METISGFIISLILVSLAMTIFGAFMGDMSHNYGVSYDNSSVEVYNKLDKLYNDTKDIQEGATGVKEKTGVLDVIGSLFSSAYSVLLTTVRSFDVFDSILNRAISDSPLGIIGKYILTALTLIVLIVIFVRILLRVIVKAEV